MRKMMHYLSCTVSIIWCTALQAETTEVVLSNSMKCTKEELMRFFPEQLVQSVLIKANVSKDQAEAIAQDLARKDRDLAKLVEEKSAQMESNSFKSLSHRDLAIKIYRETLYEVFAQVLKKHGITDDKQVQSLLDELQEARSKLFIECIRKQPTSLEPSS